MGYVHQVSNIKVSGRVAHEVMPRVHRVASLLKRWLIGTLQGGVQHSHLDYYLDEFTFRFNRRNSAFTEVTEAASRSPSITVTL